MSFTTTISSHFSLEQRAVDDALDIGLIAAGQKAQRLLGALRGARQARARGIFADLHQELLHQARNGLVVAAAAASLSQRIACVFMVFISSKTFRLVSRSRMPSRRGHSPGKAAGQRAFSRSSITRMMFSDVGTSARELAQIGVQIPVIEILEHLLGHQPIQRWNVHHLPGRRIHRTGGGHIQHVVVPMPVRIVALAVQFAILLFGECAGMQAVRSREPVAPGDFYQSRPDHDRAPA